MGTLKGMQMAGIFNNNFKEAKGIQAAGIMNNSFSDFTGLQVAGIGNGGFKTVKGSQIAGIYNFTAKDITGLQIAGIMNIAGGRSNAAQVAGIVNYAHTVKRFQIGLVNISDSCEGIPIGYFSFVQKGYHTIELGATETGILSASFRTGVTKFHNIFSIGLPITKANKGIWTYGYGIGTSKKINEKNSLDIDLSYTKLNKGRNLSAPNNIYTLYVGLDKRLSPHSSFSYGLTLNDYILDPVNYDFEDFKNFAPYTIYKSLSKYQNNMWIGLKLGLRLN
jgi:hypothetical protein